MSGPYGMVAPPPPPGPGVQPPFVAPPTDGTRRRRGWAIGLSVGALVLLCLGGVAGVGGLVVLGSRVIGEQAEGSVERYLTALRDEDFGAAYRELCGPVRARTSRAQFEATVGQRPVAGFEVGTTVLSEPIVVPATIDYADGSSRSVRFLIEQDTSTGNLHVCGEAS